MPIGAFVAGRCRTGVLGTVLLVLNQYFNANIFLLYFKGKMPSSA